MKKELENGSKYNILDTDGDGIVSDAELSRERRLMELEQKKILFENEDKKQDAQRNMAWFALFGMLLYPFAVVLANLLGLKEAPTILGNMAPTYFVSVAAIVAAFYGTQAYASKNAAQMSSPSYESYNRSSPMSPSSYDRSSPMSSSPMSSSSRSSIPGVRE